MKIENEARVNCKARTERIRRIDDHKFSTSTFLSNDLSERFVITPEPPLYFSAFFGIFMDVHKTRIVHGRPVEF